jgi:hypothetical protein
MQKVYNLSLNLNWGKIKTQAVLSRNIDHKGHRVLVSEYWFLGELIWLKAMKSSPYQLIFGPFLYQHSHDS